VRAGSGERLPATEAVGRAATPGSLTCTWRARLGPAGARFDSMAYYKADVTEEEKNKLHQVAHQ
jgi:hypothetical protein